MTSRRCEYCGLKARHSEQCSQYTNETGLTYDEWYAAATFGVPEGNKPGRINPLMREAWLEDYVPSDFAVAGSGGKYEIERLPSGRLMIVVDMEKRLAQMPLCEPDPDTPIEYTLVEVYCSLCMNKFPKADMVALWNGDSICASCADARKGGDIG